MTIEKLPSGSYRIKQMIEGKTYRITLPYKPSKKEAIEIMAQKFKRPTAPAVATFAKAAADYVEAKRNVLSISTIKEYKRYIDRLPSWFTSMNMSAIENKDIQKCINELAIDHAPKTVKCLYGFITTVFRLHDPEFKVSAALPPPRKKEEVYIPTDDEVKRILEYTKTQNSSMYAGLALACYGLRRSELCALELTDIEKTKDGLNIVHINKALLEDENKEWASVDRNKTYESTRDIVIPDHLADFIREQGFIYPYKPQSLANYLRRTQDKLGMPHFSLHKLRHYFASKLSSLGVPDADIMALGGWATDNVMKTVYRHAMEAKTNEGKKNAADKISSAIF